ncbi:hypothetical protein C9374_005915 [Naegleria lovaniensis]|uniref:Guanylate cyclase n=1 Tax=Naegleria lovaniensis TaxID=51637 RepID=A0AA88GQ50_NAELO|nr:uncharacterized protein C9374_005915 [Naegleria lovaniensis]KAG2382123.1 hypothetical protein C9374_005915 [Naegleria lovaniensis]
MPDQQLISTKCDHHGMEQSNKMESNNSSPRNTVYNMQYEERLALTALPPFFTPIRLQDHSSSIINYDRERFMIVTCKYNPQYYSGCASLPLEENVVYCVKVSLNMQSTSQLMKDAEVSKYLNNSLEDKQVIPKLYAYLSDYLILVREFVNAKNLRFLIDNSLPLSDKPSTENLQRILDYAIRICYAIDQIHAQRVFHGGIRPENIICDERNVKLIDLGHSDFLPLDSPFVYTDKPIGSGLYMSPEATGRLPKPLGFHCDIYSFGFVLFEMIAGEHPFNRNNMSNADLMYYHITQQPELLYNNLLRRNMLSSTNSLCSQAVYAMSLVISKMIRKAIEKRYASIQGVMKDLDYILKCLHNNSESSLQNFVPGEQDIQTSINIPYKVFGRDELLQQMNAVLTETMGSKFPNVILLRGHSGIGKSCLVREFRIRCGQELAYYEAKYDQHHNVPFALNQVCSSMINSILGEPEDIISNFRKQLTSVLGSMQIEMLCESIPNMNAIFSSFEKGTHTLQCKQHDEAMRMYCQSVIYLLQVFSQRKNQLLCIFLDDLQWTDYENLKLLKEMIGLGSCETFPFLLIGAFRDNEVYTSNSMHPLPFFIESIRSQAHIIEIEVKELTPDACNLLVAESLSRPQQETKRLTQILLSKTQGNPFFLKQLLVSLFKEGIIFFSRTLKMMSWKLGEIEKKSVTQNVLDYLLLKLDQIQPITRTLLGYASCIGNRFSFAELRDLLNIKRKAPYSILDVKEMIGEAITEGWVAYLDSNNLHFTHDRLQQAANKIFPPEANNTVHYTFGKYLLRRATANNGDIALDEHIFDIVVHLNHRSHDDKILGHVDKRRHLLSLNKTAAKKAINSGAVEQAQSFVDTAWTLLQQETNIWEEPFYNTAFELLIEKGNCAFASDIESGLSIFNIAILKSKTRLHLYEACYHSILAYLALGKYECVYEVLKNKIFPSNDELKFLTYTSEVDQLKSWMDIKMTRMTNQLLQNLTKQDIMQLPDLKDEEQIYLINILVMSSPGVFNTRTRSSKYVYMVLLMIAAEIILQQGLCLTAPHALGCFAWYCNTFWFLPSVNILIDAAIEISRNRYKNSQQLALCLERNDITTSILWSKRVVDIFKQMGNLMLLDASNMVLEMKRVACGESEHFSPVYTCDVTSYHSFRHVHFTCQGISYFLQQNILEAFNSFEQSNEYLEDSFGLCSAWMNALFKGLTACEYKKRLLKQDEAVSSTLIERCDKMIEDSLSILKRVSKSNPLIFQCSYELIKAESLSCRQKWDLLTTNKIVSTFNRCLKHAIQERNQFIVKLAHWKIGELYKELDMEDWISGKHFSEAFDLFNEMGVTVLADYIWENYKLQIEAYHQQTTSFQISHEVSACTKDHLASSNISPCDSDIETIAESNELDFKEIFISILPLICEHTAATRCCLLLKRNSTLFFDAEFNTVLDSGGNTNLQLVENTPLNGPMSHFLPVKMIYRTLRTKREQMLDPHEHLTENNYYQEHEIASALCLPIIRDRIAVGCIYLEHKEMQGVFCPEKISAAKLIISISIDNAATFTSINKSYSRFIPSEFLSLLGKSHVTKVNAGDAVNRPLTVVFAGIYDLTELIERLSAKDIFQFMNKLFLKIAPIISKHRGFIDKIGDGIMALFLEPQLAVNASLEMISQLDSFNRDHLFNINIGIGICNGMVSVGTVGYQQRLDITVISDTANISSRLQSLTRSFKSRILVTESVINSIQLSSDHGCATYLGKFLLKGKHVATDVYDIKGTQWPNYVFDENVQHGLSHMVLSFQLKDFEECSKIATQLVLYGNPVVVAKAQKYLCACTLYSATTLPENWSGEIRLSKEGEPYPM